LLTRLPATIQGLYPLQIRTRNFESYVLYFERDREGGAEDVWQSVKDCAVSGELFSIHVNG
jgi:myotubularin-related protein 6/7/8